MQYAENKIKTANIQMHVFFFSLLFYKTCLLPPCKVSTIKKKSPQLSLKLHHKPADLSAVNINPRQQLLQGFQFLVSLLDCTVRLHVAGDVVADVVHQGDRVRLLALL